METQTNLRPASYDDFCECGHRIGMHVELDNNYAPCAADDCSCDDYNTPERIWITRKHGNRIWKPKPGVETELQEYIRIEQHSTLIAQRERLIRTMWELLVEAEVSNVLWQQSRGFVGTVDDAYRRGLMPAAYSRAKQVLTTIEQEGTQGCIESAPTLHECVDVICEWRERTVKN